MNGKSRSSWRCRLPRLPGGPAKGLPSCPRPGHDERPVVKGGQYGSPRRQRYRCVGLVVDPKTGKVRPFHRFVPPLHRQAVAVAVGDPYNYRNKRIKGCRRAELHPPPCTK